MHVEQDRLKIKMASFKMKNANPKIAVEL